MSQSARTVRQPFLAGLITRFPRARAAPVKVKHSNIKLDAHFTRRLNFLALAILYGAYELSGQFFSGFGPGSPPTGSESDFAGLGSSEWLVMQVSVVLMAAIGVAWLLAGLTGARALRIDPHGVSAFTLFGPQSISWRDIAKIQLRQDSQNYGRQLWIHAAWGSRSKGLFHGIIPIYLERIDTPLDDIMAAIHAYRPDLNV